MAIFGHSFNKMKTLILSDIHLGNPLFKHKEYLTALLRNTEFDDRIYLLGDIFDIWEDGIDDICSEYREIIYLLNQRDVIFVIGNHDPHRSKLSEILPSAKICDRAFSPIGKKFVYIHGHQYDSLIMKYSCLTKILFIFQWIAERLGINLQAWFRNLYYSVSAKRKKSYYYGLVSDIEFKAIEEYIDEFDGVIMGHTHSPKIWRNNGFTYINCGDWIHSHVYIIRENDVYIMKTIVD